MMEELVRVLYMDDNQFDRELVRDAFEKEAPGFRVIEAAYRGQFEAKLAEGDFEVVLSDFNILGYEGLQVIDVVRAARTHVPVIIVTGTGSEEIAVEAMKRGAADYVIKTPSHIQRLPATIRAVLEKRALEDHRGQAEERILHRQAAVLQAINDVFKEVLTCETEEKLGETCLAVAERLTSSKFGFLGELNAEGLMDTIAISDPGWHVCKVGTSEARRIIKNMAIRGIDRSTIREGMSRIVNGDEMETHPDRVGTPEGHPPITAFLGVPLEHEGKTIGMIGLGNKEPGYTVADREAVEHLGVAIVEALKKKRTEDELRKAREEVVRKTQLAAIGQVSASIAHELRNPLGSVRNAVYYLRRHARNDDPSVDEFLDIIDDEVNASDRVIGNLLEMTRARAAAKRMLDLAELVEDVFSKAKDAEQVSCRFELGPDPFEVHADPDQLRQVIVNVVDNAVQAMRGQGELVVSATRTDDYDIIAFYDSGPDVPLGVRESLFDPLVTTKAKGVGLGLTICRQIIEAHDGTIDVVDREQGGAAFRVRLPRV